MWISHTSSIKYCKTHLMCLFFYLIGSSNSSSSGDNAKQHIFLSIYLHDVSISYLIGLPNSSFLGTQLSVEKLNG